MLLCIEHLNHLASYSLYHYPTMAATAADLLKLVETVLSAAKKAEGGDVGEQVDSMFRQRNCPSAGVLWEAAAAALPPLSPMFAGAQGRGQHP